MPDGTKAKKFPHDYFPSHFFLQAKTSNFATHNRFTHTFFILSYMKALLQQKNYLFLLIFLLLSNVLLAQKVKNNFPNIALEISEKNMKKLKEKRKLALYQQALGATGTDWVPAKVKFDGEKHDALVRLKGDMVDHWNDDKYWSFKVKINSNATFQGMKRFSLQHPERRAYMGEWYYHQLFEHLDLSLIHI